MYSMIHVLNHMSNIYVQYDTCAESHEQHICSVWYMCWITWAAYMYSMIHVLNHISSIYVQSHNQHFICN